ncbi:MAG: hypothetical protein WEG36_02515 [Gemmatimonadota bacterium]
MPIANQGFWARGVIAGVLGATVLALWFLIIDASLGQPFHTPSLLAHSLFGVEGLESSPGSIALYTVIHYLAFVAIGLLVTRLFMAVAWGPNTLLGVVLGFVLFDLAFYASIYITGVDVVEELGWVEVLAGNLLAGLTIMGYLRLTGTVRSLTWWEALAEHDIVREGLLAGLVGAVTVAAWFFFFDLTQGRLLFTPAALGSALLLGASNTEMIEVTFFTVGGYSILHFVTFGVIGLIASAIAWEAESRPPIILGAILLFVAFESFLLGLLAIVAEFLLGPIAWWSIAMGNVLAVAAIGIYLWQRHPKLREALASDPFDRTS